MDKIILETLFILHLFSIIFMKVKHVFHAISYYWNAKHK